MDPEITQIVTDRYESLPDSLQEVIMRSTTTQYAHMIGVNHGLTEEKADILTNLVVLTLLTLEDPNRFAERAAEILGISIEAAHGITHDVDATIFARVRDDIMKTWNDRVYFEKHGEVPPLPVDEDELEPEEQLRSTAQQPVAPLPSYARPLTFEPAKKDPYREQPE